MCSVGVAAHGLPQHMHHPVGAFAAGDQGVQRPGGGPHDVAAGLIVLGIAVGDAAGVQQRAHQAFAEIVAGAVVFAGEVLFADMVENIVNAGCHLVVG